MFQLAARFSGTVLIGTLLFFPLSAKAATDADAAAAVKNTAAECRAQVKEYAKYNDTSWLGRRKMVKKCAKGMPWRKN
jgi:hypothetical protein